MRGLIMYSKEVMPSVRCPVVNQGVPNVNMHSSGSVSFSKESLQFDE